MTRKINIQVAIVLVLLYGFQMTVKSQNCAQDQYFMTQHVYPSNASPYWHTDLDEIQGVANDGYNWFMSSAYLVSVALNGDKVYTNGSLWRIPVSTDLAMTIPPPDAEVILASNIPEIYNLNFVHFGDPDSYLHTDGETYILVPTHEGEDTGQNLGAIICIRASDMQYINFTYVYGEEPGFCLVDNEGHIFVKNNQNSLTKYTTNWDILLTLNGGHNALNDPVTINLNFSNSGITEIDTWQGGEFTDSGDYLYISSGAANGGGSQEDSDGINVFQVTSGNTWTWVDQSKDVNSAVFPFTFLFNNGFLGTQSPQGLTIWDIDDQSYPAEVRGKLHVLLFDFDLNWSHSLYFYHFSDYIHVDVISGLEQVNFVRRVGSIEKPFKHFNDAFFHYPAWSGSTIVLKAGTYEDTGTYNECVKIKSEGGAAVIGQ